MNAAPSGLDALDPALLGGLPRSADEPLRDPRPTAERADARYRQTEAPERERKRRYRAPLAVQCALIILIFLAVPALLYAEFRKADEERTALLLTSLHEQGRILAQALAPALSVAQPSPLVD